MWMQPTKIKRCLYTDKPIKIIKHPTDLREEEQICDCEDRNEAYKKQRRW